MILVVAKEGELSVAQHLASALRSAYESDVSVVASEFYDAIIRHPNLKSINKIGIIDYFSFYGEVDSIARITGTQDVIYSFREDELNRLEFFLKNHVHMEAFKTGRMEAPQVVRADLVKYYSLLFDFYCSVIEKLSPHIVFDPYPNTVSRFVFQLACERYQIKYLTMFHSRYDDYLVISESVDEPGVKLRSKYEKDKTAPILARAKKIVIDFRKKTEVLSNDELNFQKKYARYGLVDVLKVTLSSVKWIIHNKTIVNRQSWFKNVDGAGFKQLIIGSSPRAAFLNVMTASRVLLRSTFNIKKAKTVKGPFFYWPLSYCNEGESIFTKGGFFDTSYLEMIRYSLSLSDMIVIKDHRAMLGERSRCDIKFIKSIKEFLFVSPLDEKYADPIQLLRNSKGVITVNGTSGLEALLLGRPALILGKPIYWQFISGVQSNIYSDIHRFFKYPEEYICSIEKTSEYVGAIIDQDIYCPSYASFLKMSLHHPSDEELMVCTAVATYIVNNYLNKGKAPTCKLAACSAFS